MIEKATAQETERYLNWMYRDVERRLAFAKTQHEKARIYSQLHRIRRRAYECGASL
jgi:primosomal protein N''